MAMRNPAGDNRPTTKPEQQLPLERARRSVCTTINRYGSPNNTIKRRSTRKDKRAQSPHHSDTLGSELCFNLQTYKDFLSFLNNPEIKLSELVCFTFFIN
ncbi:hypothetical protein ILYODFUR_016245 [Ilyodon furcidens]|uniref:Uncharacterized protein n=1 Tax=Ilyodon furcidens TaxID=33524 RepID=A0ABV0TK88_9TELE